MTHAPAPLAAGCDGRRVGKQPLAMASLAISGIALPNHAPLRR